MKKILLSAVALLIASTSFAQDGNVASLTSSETNETTMFYGSSALKSAVTAAMSGDIINLSAGTFFSTTIDKAITLRGAGIDSDEPTYIQGEFTISIPADDPSRFTMEGIICKNAIKMPSSSPNPQFVKCELNGFTTDSKSTSTYKNLLVVNCRVIDHFHVGNTCSASLINSYIDGAQTYDGTSTLFGLNCVLWKDRVDLLENTMWKNCIFFSGKNYNYILPVSCKATNCIAVNYQKDIFTQVSSREGCPETKYTYGQVFTDFTGTYSNDVTFTLTDEAKAFLGTDGKEIGLYGGLQPFDTTVSYPLISTMTVDEQTNDNGQLNVKIEVK